MTPKDIDALFTYDAFSILPWIALERFGFCKPGEAPAFTQDGRIEVGGELPMNTNGGLLSEAHMMGWNHQVEIVRQLRGECGRRQVAGRRRLSNGRMRTAIRSSIASDIGEADGAMRSANTSEAASGHLARSTSPTGTGCASAN